MTFCRMKQGWNELALHHGLHLLLCEALLVARFATGALILLRVDFGPFPVSDSDLGFGGFFRIGVVFGGFVGEVFGHCSSLVREKQVAASNRL